MCNYRIIDYYGNGTVTENTNVFFLLISIEINTQAEDG